MGGDLWQTMRNVDLELRPELIHLGIFCLQKNLAQRDEEVKNRSVHNAFIPRARESGVSKGDSVKRRNWSQVGEMVHSAKEETNWMKYQSQRQKNKLIEMRAEKGLVNLIIRRMLVSLGKDCFGL